MTSITKSVKISKGKTEQPNASKETAAKTVTPKGKVDKANAAKIGSDLALNSRTKYIYPEDCSTPAKRKAYRAKFRKNLAAASKELKGLAKKTDADSVKRAKELEASITQLKTTRSDMK